MSETHEHRLKRLRMRSNHRGIKEMDLILGGFCDTGLDALGVDDLDLYDVLLNENDQDLYQWVSGQTPPPERFVALVDLIRTDAERRIRHALTEN